MKKLTRLVFSILTGILLSLAWLGFPGWILFFALIPLLYLDHYFVKQKENFRTVSFFGHAFLAMLIWNVITTFWVANATLVGALMAFAVNSLAMASTWWLAHWARRKHSSKLGYACIIFFWISLEYIHYHWDIEWPWLHLGNGFANNIKMIQWYEFTGIFGGTLWVLSMNILIFKILLSIQKERSLKKSTTTISAGILLLAIPTIVSYIMYSCYVEKEIPKNIVIIQPNVNPYSEEFGINAEYDKLRNFVGLVKSKSDESTDFIIGPETVFEHRGLWNEDKLAKNPLYNELVNITKGYSNAEMIFGVASSKFYADKESATETARISGELIYDVFNSAFYIDRNGKNQIYHKSKLVVGVEKMPFMKYLGFMGDIVIDIGGTTGSFGRQKEPSNFTSKDGTKVAPVICYESIFGEYVTDYIRKGAQLIVIITNDGWWKNTPGYKQHMSFARLRAIETRRSIARSANTGISCFINQRGDVFQPTGWWVDAAIKGTLNANDEMTFYVKYGDYIARISLFISLLLLLNLVVKRFMNR